MTRSKVTPAIVLLSLFFSNCTETNKTVVYDFPGEPVTISGTLFVWSCMVGYPYGPPAQPFSIETGEPANISILYPNGWVDTFPTDDSSRFQRVTSVGVHKLVISTRYTWPPDTIQFYLEEDTTLRLDIVYDVHDPETLVFTFRYPSAQDSLGAQKEWDLLRILNGLLNVALDTYGFEPRLDRRSLFVLSGIIYVHYNIPISRSDVNHVLVVGEAAATAITGDSRLSPWLSVYPKGIYACLD